MRLLQAALILFGLLNGQTPVTSAPEFEVASIKPNKTPVEFFIIDSAEKPMEN